MWLLLAAITATVYFISLQIVKDTTIAASTITVCTRTINTAPKPWCDETLLKEIYRN